MTTFRHICLITIGLLLGVFITAPAAAQTLEVRGGLASGASVVENADGLTLLSQLAPASPVSQGASNGLTLRSGPLFLFSARARSFVVERPGPVSAGSSVTIRVTVQSPEPIVGATLNYRQGGSGSLQSVEMQVNDGSVVGEIPGDVVTTRGLGYFITLVDASGNEFRAPREGVFSLSVNVDEGDIVRADPLPGGQSQGAYRLIAIPVALQDPDPEPFLTDNLGPPDSEQWRFFELLEGERVREFPETSDLEPGRGFWLIAREAGIELSAGEGRTVSLDEPFEREVRSGWNLIGAPFNFAIPVENISVGDEEEISIRSFGPSDWNNPTSDPVEMLEPFVGYALFNPSESSEVIRFDPDVPDEEDLIAEQREADVEWAVRLRVTAGSEARAEVVAGASADARDGWDSFDHPQPPSLFSDVAITFPRDWDHTANNFSTDIRSLNDEGDVWPFTVEATSEERARVQMLDADKLPEGWHAWIVDDEADAAYEVSSGETLELPSGGAISREYRFLAGSEAFLSREIGELMAPAEITLEGGYPNPFRDAVHIRYGLPEDADARLVIFDTLGREVALLVDEEQRAGFHEVVWEGRDRTGSPVASGVYFARLLVDGRSLTESIVRVR